MARCDFVNARLGARRTRLLGARGLRELMAREEAAARRELLRGSGWAPSLPPEGAAALDEGLFAFVQREAERLGAELEGRRQRALWRVPLALIAAARLRGVLRALAAGEPPPAADDDPLLADAARQPDLSAAIGRLAAGRHPLAPSLAAALPAYEKYRDFSAVEHALDRALVDRALRLARGRGEDGALVARLVRLAVDLRNGATWLALGDGGADRLLPGGALAPRELPRAVAAWLGEAADEARARPFHADRLLARVLVDACRREARARPLSLAVPLAFLLELADEARRIRLVLRGASFGLPADELADLVGA